MYSPGELLQISVRSGHGSVVGRDFNDVVEVVDRVPRFHSRWQSIRYKCKRYQLFGGVRTPYFICLNNPIKGRT